MNNLLRSSTLQPGGFPLEIQRIVSFTHQHTDFFFKFCTHKNNALFVILKQKGRGGGDYLTGAVLH